MRFLLVVIIGGTLGCSRTPAPATKGEPKPGAKITQFYASPPTIPKGTKSLLCYGVEGARSVRIEPPVEQLSPSLTRCFEVQPDKTVNYTLVAADKEGAEVKQTVTVTVGGAAPKMIDISINAKTVKRGEQVTFCFKATNATTVTGGPGKFLKGGNAKADCLLHNPTTTTEYSLTVSNADGISDSASITVQVK